MCSLLAGGIEKLRARPFVSFITLVISPLKIDDIYGEMTCYLAEQGLPVVVPTEPLCGDHLAGDAGVQLLPAHRREPGRRDDDAVDQSRQPGDVRQRGQHHRACAPWTTSPAQSSAACINAAVSQMAQYYQLPNYSTAGMTDAKVVDAQAGYESGMMNLLVAMSGANYIHDAAGLDGVRPDLLLRETGYRRRDHRALLARAARHRNQRRYAALST